MIGFTEMVVNMTEISTLNCYTPHTTSREGKCSTNQTKAQAGKLTGFPTNQTKPFLSSLKTMDRTQTKPCFIIMVFNSVDQLEGNAAGQSLICERSPFTELGECIDLYLAYLMH